MIVIDLIIYSTKELYILYYIYDSDLILIHNGKKIAKSICTKLNDPLRLFVS